MGGAPPDDGPFTPQTPAGAAGAAGGPATHSASTSSWIPAAVVPPQRMASAFVPVLILLLATGAWSGFQFMQLRVEAQALATVRTNQEAPLQQAQRARQGLEALAAQTRQLADNGNPNARLVVAELARRGVTIGPPQAASAPR
jgi:hypothetical protein